jgi:hypothetical protein
MSVVARVVYLHTGRQLGKWVMRDRIYHIPSLIEAVAVASGRDEGGEIKHHRALHITHLKKGVHLT